jgi:hypothetical protein
MRRISISLIIPLGCLFHFTFPAQGFVALQRTCRHTPQKLVQSPQHPLFYSILGGISADERPLSSFVNLPDYSLVPTEEDAIPLHENQRLVCVGDVHGDAEALRRSLDIAGLCKDDSWIGNDTILVQCGDVLDRGSEELACFSLLAKLSQQAVQVGGKVICLYGNHEALNAMGLFQYTTTDSEYEEVVGPVVDDALNTQKWRAQYVGNQPARWASFEPNGLLSKSLMANMKVAVQVGRTVCVHAGLTKKQLKDYGGIEGMNQQAKEWITSHMSDVKYNNQGIYSNQLQPWVEAEARQTTYINTAPVFLGGGIGSISPVWMRDYSSPNDQPPKNPKAQFMIDAALKELECDRMVMGHTIQRQINCALNGKAWRIDVGMSRGVASGTPEVLEVIVVNGAEVVSVLTCDGKIPGHDRHIVAMANLF